MRRSPRCRGAACPQYGQQTCEYFAQGRSSSIYSAAASRRGQRPQRRWQRVKTAHNPDSAQNPLLREGLRRRIPGAAIAAAATTTVVTPVLALIHGCWPGKSCSTKSLGVSRASVCTLNRERSLCSPCPGALSMRRSCCLGFRVWCRLCPERLD